MFRPAHGDKHLCSRWATPPEAGKHHTKLENGGKTRLLKKTTLWLGAGAHPGMDTRTTMDCHAGTPHAGARASQHGSKFASSSVFACMSPFSSVLAGQNWCPVWRLQGQLDKRSLWFSTVVLRQLVVEREWMEVAFGMI